MPRAFNESEREAIDGRLRKFGRELFSSGGLTKTSIDQLVDAAGIAKGSFYQFYDSKELLFMSLLEETEARVRAPLLEGRSQSRKSFEREVRGLFDEMCRDPLLTAMGDRSDAIVLMRRLPPEYLKRHEQRDQEFLERLIDRWNTHRVRPKRDRVAARVSTLVLLTMNLEFMGDRLFPHAVDAAIESLALCFFA